MFDALVECLDMAEHHGGRANSTELVPNSHDIEPIVGHDFATRNFAANTIDQDFSAAARQAPQASLLESFEHLPQRKMVELGEVIYLGRAEAMNVDLWKACLDVRQQLFIPLELKFGMQAALHQDLIAPQGDGLFDFFEQFSAGQHVAFVALGRTIKRGRNRRPPCIRSSS